MLRMTSAGVILLPGGDEGGSPSCRVDPRILIAGEMNLSLGINIANGPSKSLSEIKERRIAILRAGGRIDMLLRISTSLGLTDTYHIGKYSTYLLRVEVSDICASRSDL